MEYLGCLLLILRREVRVATHSEKSLAFKPIHSENKSLSYIEARE